MVLDIVMAFLKEVCLSRGASLPFYLRPLHPNFPPSHLLPPIPQPSTIPPAVLYPSLSYYLPSFCSHLHVTVPSDPPSSASLVPLSTLSCSSLWFSSFVCISVHFYKYKCTLQTRTHRWKTTCGFCLSEQGSPCSILYFPDLPVFIFFFLQISFSLQLSKIHGKLVPHFHYPLGSSWTFRLTPNPFCCE